MKTFFSLLVNTLLVSLINFTVWFAITFYVFLQTRSVFATGWIAGIYLVATALTGIWFGSLVDHYRKKTVMQLSALVSLVMYTASLALYLITPEERFRDPTSATLWAFVLLLVAGVIVGNIRMIAMPTVVTILIPEDRRDRANGLVGTASGISFLVTSVISGLQSAPAECSPFCCLPWWSWPPPSFTWLWCRFPNVRWQGPLTAATGSTCAARLQSSAASRVRWR